MKFSDLLQSTTLVLLYSVCNTFFTVTFSLEEFIGLSLIINLDLFRRNVINAAIRVMVVS